MRLDHYSWHPDLVGANTVPAAPGTWLLDAERDVLQRYAVVAWTVVGCRAYPVLAAAALGRVDDLRDQRAILFPDGHVELVGVPFEAPKAFASLEEFEGALPDLKAGWAEELAAYHRGTAVGYTVLPDNVVPLMRSET